MFIVICIGIIILSKNRSAQISLIITSPFLFMLVKARTRYIFLPFVIIVVMAIALKIPYVREMLLERYQQWFMGGEVISNILLTDSISIDLWSSAIKIFLDHPVFGIGAGMWEEVYHRYTSMPGTIIEFSGNKPHSLLLQYFAQRFASQLLIYYLFFFYGITIYSHCLSVHEYKRESKFFCLVKLFVSDPCETTLKLSLSKVAAIETARVFSIPGP